ncbi:hypothetical protein Pcinc_039996 [Petrolisthes cinctipes]|uniref:Uncharacterized protein n=1 Tax=Petrolisthes cinctipes TaxID=88211 RepID=A0AAE1BMS7_PETCI|nr:hypothetical protein Pcinc_039996 [Petrolisthes cinctipes]
MKTSHNETEPKQTSQIINSSHSELQPQPTRVTLSQPSPGDQRFTITDRRFPGEGVGEALPADRRTHRRTKVAALHTRVDGGRMCRCVG